jgi:hypothetical protein
VKRGGVEKKGVGRGEKLKKAVQRASCGLTSLDTYIITRKLEVISFVGIYVQEDVCGIYHVVEVKATVHDIGYSPELKIINLKLLNNVLIPSFVALGAPTTGGPRRPLK